VWVASPHGRRSKDLKQEFSRAVASPSSFTVSLGKAIDYKEEAAYKPFKISGS
jgi:hypothetical protein